MRRQVRPTLVIGVGTPAVHVAAEVLHVVHTDLADLPVVDVVAICDGTTPLPAAVTHTHRWPKNTGATGTDDDESAQLRSTLAGALDDLYRVDVVQLTRALGWDIRRSQGGAIVLIVAHAAVASVPDIMATLHAVIAQQPARRLAVTGVLLAADGDTGDAMGAFTTALFAQPTCVEGVYTVTPTNVLGLTTTNTVTWERMIARWIVELATTPLGLSVAALPLHARLPEAATVELPPGGFGLARWQFPQRSLAQWLQIHLQWDMLDYLLEPGDDVDMAVLATIRDRCAPPNVLPELPPTDFAATRPVWSHPDLRGIHNLRAEIDAAATPMLAQAQALTGTWTGQLDESFAAAVHALDSELAAWCETPRAGCLPHMLALLAAIRDVFLNTVRVAETAAEAQEAQHTAAVQALETLGTALTGTVKRFPAWSLRAWWRVISRPWRWLTLFTTYREIVRLAQAYAACYEARWLATLRACEARWRASYARALADDVATRLAALQTGVAALAAQHEALNTAGAASQKLDRLLADATLPATLKSLYYTSSVNAIAGEVRVALIASGELWAYLHPEPRVESLLATLADHAFERFSFLPAIRLDEVLVRTHSGADLRTRLAELVEAAAPFLPGAAGADKAANGYLKRTWVGLPIAEEAKLVDLLPDRGIEYYSTGDPGTITVTQMWLPRPPLNPPSYSPPIGGS